MKELVEYIARAIVSAPNDVKVTAETDSGMVSNRKLKMEMSCVARSQTQFTSRRTGPRFVRRARR